MKFNFKLFLLLSVISSLLLLSSCDNKKQSETLELSHEEMHAEIKSTVDNSLDNAESVGKTIKEEASGIVDTGVSNANSAAKTILDETKKVVEETSDKAGQALEDAGDVIEEETK